MTMTTRPRRPGYALMLVILEMVLLTALWGIANRQLMTTARFLNQFGAVSPSPSSNDGYKPLARALSLLETGNPPDGGTGFYSCNATILVAGGTPAYFTITYLLQPPESSDTSADTRWMVQSIQQSPDATRAKTWDTMPSTFGY